MTSSAKHARRAFLFIATCVLLGIGLFVLSRFPLQEASSYDVTDAQRQHEPVHAVRQDLGQPDPQIVQDDDQSVAESSAATEASVSSESVWADQDSGAFDCQLDGSTQRVHWRRVGRSDQAEVRINNRTVVGTLVGDWQPSTNTVRYDFAGDVPEIRSTLAISDSGVFTIASVDSDESAEGQCRRV